jgi:hypothetical protein
MTEWKDSDTAVGSLRPGMAEAIEAGGGTVFEVVDWKDEDEVTTTFASIRQGMAEAAEAERERIVALLRGMDAGRGMNGHKDEPSSVCRICRAITAIKVSAS